MSRRRRALLTYLVVAGAIFALGLAGGFFFEHDPERDVVSLNVDRSPRPNALPGELLRGSLLAADSGSLRLDAVGGPVAVELTPDTSIEELVRVGADALGPGTSVNLGGERTPFGLILTGIVAIEGRP